jgi:hypothetical protein
MTHHHNVRLSDRGKSPQLPAFCRTRRPITTTVRVSTLQQLLWLLLLVGTSKNKRLPELLWT